MADVATTETRANTPTKRSYTSARYKSDPDFARLHREKVNAAYKSMPADKKAELLARQTARYFNSPEIQERQRRTSREYYHKKKAALQVSQTAVTLAF